MKVVVFAQNIYGGDSACNNTTAGLNYLFPFHAVFTSIRTIL